MSYLVQILLPLADNQGQPFSEALLREVHAGLVARFGGLTAHTRAPAKGIWKHHGAHKIDDIAVVEVMTETLDEDWWRQFRRSLETLLRQDAIVVRAQEIRAL